MNYQNTVDYLFQETSIYQNVMNTRLDIGNIVESCYILGNPHLNLSRYISTGTNGKGSSLLI